MSTLLDDLARDACLGDRAAWDELVDRCAGLVWMMAREEGLGRGDCGAVSELVWLRFSQKLGQAARIDGVVRWLADATSEAIRQLAPSAGRRSHGWASRRAGAPLVAGTAAVVHGA